MTDSTFDTSDFPDGLTTILGADTNTEPTVVDAHDPRYYKRCYWAGKAFLSYMLSDVVLRTSPASWTGDELDSALLQAQIDFPYADCIEKIDALKSVDIPHLTSSQTDSSQWMFATKLGVVAERHPSLKAKLASLIQSRGGAVAINLDPLQALPPSPPESVDGDQEEGNRIAIYTMKLNEWCAKRNRSIESSDRPVRLDPPLWEVRVNVDGSSYTGRAKKKSNARHLAAKQACEALDIDA